MVEAGNEIFDEQGNFKKEIIPTLVGQLIQESFVTGILYINLTTDNGQSGEISPEVNQLHGFPELRTKDSIFAELSEKINFEKMSTQVSQLLDVATNRLEEIDVTSLQNDFAKSNFALQAFQAFQIAIRVLVGLKVAHSGKIINAGYFKIIENFKSYVSLITHFQFSDTFLAM